MKRKLIVTLCAVVGVAFLAAGPMFAHHGAAAYDTRKPPRSRERWWISILSIPIASFLSTRPTRAAKMVKWDGEFTNPGTLHRRGWTKDMFKPGDQITMIGNRAKNGATVLRVLKLEMSDGKVITALGAQTITEDSRVRAASLHRREARSRVCACEIRNH